MISFIVIGRNEEEHLHKCFRSIRRACEENLLQEYEIVYVDSNSLDRSVEIALTNNVEKICRLTIVWNAAIGRNIGAKQAAGDILCFLDGDMEIVPSFIPLILDEEKSLKYDLVSGDLLHYYYDEQSSMVGTKREFSHLESMFQKPITGGAFWIKKEIYDSIGGMDNRMRVSEDPELGLRLAKRGILLWFLPNVFIIHHTDIPKSVRIGELLKCSWLYGSVYIYKFNLMNPYTYKRMIRHDVSLIVLATTLLGSFFISPFLLALYPLCVLVRSKGKPTKFVYLVVRDILSLICFIPAYKKRIKTENIPFEIVRQGIK